MQKIFLAAVIAGLFAGVSTAQAAGIQDKFSKSCGACHTTGAVGAPKKGDKAAWAPRLKQGEATLLSHVKNGYKAMPAKGLCTDCTDADFKALIKFMSH